MRQFQWISLQKSSLPNHNIPTYSIEYKLNFPIETYLLLLKLNNRIFHLMLNTIRTNRFRLRKKKKRRNVKTINYLTEDFVCK